MLRSKNMRMFSSFFMALVAAIFWPVASADGEEIPFDDLKLFFEFNSTDNDLGVQLLLDGEAWDRLKIFDPAGRKLLDIKAQGNLGELGLTELFWESDEPSPAEVLALFPAGTYQFEGKTVEGDELRGEATLSQQLPAAPTNLSPEGEVDDEQPVDISWEGNAGDASYQVILEREDLGLELLVVTLPDASITSITIPSQILEDSTEYKYEVLAVGANGNKTITETEFVTDP